jgi:hypothetical protein
MDGVAVGAALVGKAEEGVAGGGVGGGAVLLGLAVEDGRGVGVRVANTRPITVAGKSSTGKATGRPSCRSTSKPVAAAAHSTATISEPRAWPSMRCRCRKLDQLRLFWSVRTAESRLRIAPSPKSTTPAERAMEGMAATLYCLNLLRLRSRVAMRRKAPTLAMLPQRGLGEKQFLHGCSRWRRMSWSKKTKPAEIFRRSPRVRGLRLREGPGLRYKRSPRRRWGFSARTAVCRAGLMAIPTAGGAANCRTKRWPSWGFGGWEILNTPRADDHAEHVTNDT